MMAVRREWHANGVSWRVVPHSGGLVAEWLDGYYRSRTFYGYTRRDAARLVAAERRASRAGA